LSGARLGRIFDARNPERSRSAMSHIQVPEDSSNARAVAVVGGMPVSSFAFSFPFFDIADIKVYRDGAAVSSGFTVSGTGDAVDGGFKSGSVTFSAEQSNCTIVIERDVALSRTDDFPYPSPTFNIKVLNTTLDRIFAIFQQFRRQSSGTLRAPPGDTAPIGEMPGTAARAGKLFGFDDAGNPVASNLTLAQMEAGAVDAAAAAAAAAGSAANASAVSATAASRAGEAAASAAAAAAAAAAVQGLLPSVALGSRFVGFRIVDANLLLDLGDQSVPIDAYADWGFLPLAAVVGVGSSQNLTLTY
jgi:uncharacterized protein YaiE (UPF0345 family)